MIEYAPVVPSLQSNNPTTSMGGDTYSMLLSNTGRYDIAWAIKTVDSKGFSIEPINGVLGARVRFA